MKITVIGHGYVGLVTAAVFADLGNSVYVVGRTAEKIENLNKGIIPIYEPGLEELVKQGLSAKRLHFSLEYDPYVSESDIVFIAVGTPPKSSGEADLSTVLEVAKKIGTHLNGYTVVATKSTVPVGSNKMIARILAENKDSKAKFDTASVPEFLREGSAIHDTLNPDRIVIGTKSQRAQDLLITLHKPINSRFVLCNLETAEMIKYAANSFLATKISFANAIAKLSEKVSADALSVLEGIGYDKRIGNEFLLPGAGYGGSCFPKDVKALIAISKQHGYDFALLSEVENINKEARHDIVKKAVKMLGEVQGKKIGILGLAFKPNTDDMRNAPSIDIIASLSKMGATIKVYDPQGAENAKKIIQGATFCKDSYEVAENADLLIILTEWNEFKEINLAKIKEKMREPKILDGRNIYDPEEIKELGFVYQGVGRA